MMKKTIFLIAFFSSLVIIIGCKEDDYLRNNIDESLKSASIADEVKFMPNEMLVKFKEGLNETQKAAVLAKVNGKAKEKILTKAMEKAGDKEGITLVSLPGAALEAIARVKGLSEIEYVEPNYIYEHYDVSNDPYFTSGQLWGINSSFGCQAQIPWASNNIGSYNVFIGIIDEGYMYTHEDLAANAGTNPGEIAGNGNDDDGNGYVDDVYGWDFDKNDNSVFDGTADDHGTHVAGTIGAVGGNGIGVTGICWNVKLLDAKFLGNRGGTTANAVKAVDYFTDLKTSHGINIVATNNSWGGGGFSQALMDAISRANEADILFIAAAGNSGSDNDAKPSYPSGYNVDNVIAVASITSTGALSSFSQYGATTVDLGAPGSGIWSTVPKKSGKNIVPGYAYYSGTSMATPHVTGAAALYASTHKNASAASIKDAILNAARATTTPSLAGKCATGGRLNVSGF